MAKALLLKRYRLWSCIRQNHGNTPLSVAWRSLDLHPSNIRVSPFFAVQHHISAIRIFVRSDGAPHRTRFGHREPSPMCIRPGIGEIFVEKGVTRDEARTHRINRLLFSYLWLIRSRVFCCIRCPTPCLPPLPRPNTALILPEYNSLTGQRYHLQFHFRFHCIIMTFNARRNTMNQKREFQWDRPRAPFTIIKLNLIIMIMPSIFFTASI